MDPDGVFGVMTDPSSAELDRDAARRDYVEWIAKGGFRAAADGPAHGMCSYCAKVTDLHPGAEDLVGEPLCMACYGVTLAESDPDPDDWTRTDGSGSVRPMDIICMNCEEVVPVTTRPLLGGMDLCDPCYRATFDIDGCTCEPLQALPEPDCMYHSKPSTCTCGPSAPDGFCPDHGWEAEAGTWEHLDGELYPPKDPSSGWDEQPVLVRITLEVMCEPAALDDLLVHVLAQTEEEDDDSPGQWRVAGWDMEKWVAPKQ